jgi:hypothetical protein
MTLSTNMIIKNNPNKILYFELLFFILSYNLEVIFFKIIYENIELKWLWVQTWLLKITQIKFYILKEYDIIYNL